MNRKKKTSRNYLKYILLSYIVFVLAVGTQQAYNNQTTLSAVAAKYVDETLPHKKMDAEDRFVGGLKARLVSLFVYPIYAAVDSSYFLISSGLNYIGSKVFDEPHSSLYSTSAFNDFVMARRSLTGLISFPVGIISGDYVTRHFVPEQISAGMIESGGRYYAAEGDLIYPVSGEHVQQLVRYAKENDRKVVVMGAGLSQGKHFLPNDRDDLVLNLSTMKQVTVNPQTKTAAIQAGATWRDVQEAINPYGLSIQVMQASNIFSVGGSLSANCHGWDHRAGAISNTVVSLKVVDANGDLQEVKPGDEIFGYIIGGYGCFGVIVEAEIQLTDNVELVDTGEEVAIDEYVSYFKEKIQPDETIKMHLYRLSLDPDALLSEGVAQNYIANTKNIVLSNLYDEAHNGRLIERVGVHSGRKFAIVRKKYWQQEKVRIQKDRQTTRNDEMRAPIHAMLNHSRHDTEWLQEFFVPGEELADYLKELGSLLTRYQVSLINASVRYIKEDPDIILGYNRDGERFAVVLCFNQPLNERETEYTKEWVKQAIELTLQHKGTYYLPYQHFASEEQFRQSYPAFDQFVKAKKKYDPNEIFWSQFYEHHLAYNQENVSKIIIPTTVDSSYQAYQQVFKSHEQRREFRKFLRNIFLNLNEDAFMKLVDKSLEKVNNDQELYLYLQNKLDDVSPNTLTGTWRSLKALRHQKRELRKQLIDLVQENSSFDGYVEIGFPGRMTNTVKDLYSITGKSCVVNTEESITDYIQSGFPRPYDQFVPLKQYAPLTESIDPESVDLVTCFIGLHHCPEQNLESFAQSIADILRPGGSFILRDHDAGDPQSKAMAYLAHTTFNLGTGVPWDGIGDGLDESTEVRNFQGLAYWDALMARHGLVRDSSRSPIFRPGDPTKNALVRYVKIGERQPLILGENQRKQLQTFMTTVEWHSVRVAREYAAFIEHTPFYLYPYFDQIKIFWKLFAQSWKEARQYHSAMDIISSEYFLMNGFITVFHTIEFSAKGLISWPIAALYQQEDNLEPDTILVVINDPNHVIDSFISKGVVIDQKYEGETKVTAKMPRYIPFRDLILEMTERGVELISVAGQKQIQIQCTLPKESLNTLVNIHGSRVIGHYDIPTDKSTTVAYLNVEIAQLHRVIPALQNRGINIDYIHDF